LESDFLESKRNYVGTPFTDEYRFDVELIAGVINQLKRGKAAGLDNIMAEHLQYSHPVLPCLLTKLFNLMLEFSYVSSSFDYNYIVPIAKSKDFHNKAFTTDDFRGIAISSLLWAPAQRKRATMLYFANVFYLFIFFMAALFSGPG